MTEELVGVRLEDWRSFDDLARMKLQALWSLTEGYWDTARRLRGAAEGLEELIFDAKRWGVYYDPPSCTMAAIEHKAYWARKAAERRARDLHRLAPLLERYHSDDTEPMRIRHYEPLQLVPEDRREWAKHPRMTERDRAAGRTCLSSTKQSSSSSLTLKGA